MISQSSKSCESIHHPFFLACRINSSSPTKIGDGAGGFFLEWVILKDQSVKLNHLIFFFLAAYI